MSTSEDENSQWCGSTVDIILWILIVISALCVLYLIWRALEWRRGGGHLKQTEAEWLASRGSTPADAF